MPTGKTTGPSVTLKEKLRRENLKWNWDAVAADCLAEPELLPMLLEFCTDPEVAVQQNAGSVLGKIIDLDEAILVPHLPKMLENLKSEPHDAVKRATMRVLRTIEIPEAVEGEVFDVAMRFVSDYEEAIAVRGFAMTTARRLCERYPTLRHELQPVVEDLIEQKASTGLSSRARCELKKLQALGGD